ALLRRPAPRDRRRPRRLTGSAATAPQGIARVEHPPPRQGDTVTVLPRLLALALLCIAAAGPARAADYPGRPVKWVVPYPPAGTTDVLARIVAQWLTEKL